MSCLDLLLSILPTISPPNQQEIRRRPDFRTYSLLTTADTTLFLSRLADCIDQNHGSLTKQDQLHWVVIVPKENHSKLVQRLENLCFAFRLPFALIDSRFHQIKIECGSARVLCLDVRIPDLCYQLRVTLAT